MAAREFIDQLIELGHAVQVHAENRISFPYEIPLGRFRGKSIQLGFIINDDYPANCPGGPRMSPRLLPLSPNGEHPNGRIHEAAEFGPDWEYWSRPFPDWNTTDRSAKAYMKHINRLFDQ